TWLTLALTGTRSVRPYVVAAAGFAWPIAALAIWLPAHWSIAGETFTRYHIAGSIVRPTAIADRISTYWRFFDPAFLFLIGGYTRMTNSTRLVGVFPITFLILIPVGIVQVVSFRSAQAFALHRERPQSSRSISASGAPVALLSLAGFLLAPLAASIAVP